MSKCAFDIAWIGKCGKEDCKEHGNLKCVSCGAKATRECDATMGLVCGALLCGDCEHELDEKGTTGWGTGHVPKAEQKYKPWDARSQQAGGEE
ncbi:hypothetical protein [Flexibacterium corallicola]|uniref:hypothetical protein n=1 Tax=Flexibacterium corallicola TaxID=3037259 RepID=UPI00286ECE13|nr:hypothetical protein [Pseudovibrio sp. M1P-2-3]